MFGSALVSWVAFHDLFLLCLPVLRLFHLGEVGGRLARMLIRLVDVCASCSPSSLSDCGSFGETHCWLGSDWVVAALSPDSSSHESLRTMSLNPSVNDGELPVRSGPPGGPVQRECSPGDLETSTMGALVRMVHSCRLGSGLTNRCCLCPLN